VEENPWVGISGRGFHRRQPTNSIRALNEAERTEPSQGEYLTASAFLINHQTLEINGS